MLKDFRRPVTKRLIQDRIKLHSIILHLQHMDKPISEYEPWSKWSKFYRNLTGKLIYPLVSKVCREVANLTEIKNIHTHV